MTDKERQRTFSSFTVIAALVATFVAVSIHLLLQDFRILHLIDKALTWCQGADLQTNPYLNGNFAPVAAEHHSVPLAVIEGAIPDDLAGIFVRNGPNPIPGLVSKNHFWFDGHGMMHNVRIRNGKATYSNSYVPTPRFNIEMEKGEEVFFKLGEMKGIAGLIKLLFVDERKKKAVGANKLTSGQANTHAIMYQNKFYALHEGSLPFEVMLTDEGAVKGIGYETFGGVLDYPLSAHPKKDFENGNLIFHSYSADPFFIDKDGPIKVGELSSQSGTLNYYFGIRGDHNSMSHDLMFTPNWAVLYDSSVVLDYKSIFEGGFGYGWHEEHTMKIGLVPRKRSNATSQDVVWIDVGSPHATFHPMNAWEEKDGTVVLWLPLSDHFCMDLEQSKNVYYMAELRMNPQTGAVSKATIDDKYNTEFCRVRDDSMGKFARYGYAAWFDSEQEHEVDAVFCGFIVYDMKRRAVHKAVRYPESEFGGEPVIVPKPGTSESNEVYIGTFLYNEASRTSSFALYDGDTGDLVVRLHVPFRVPYGFHGRWVDEVELQNHIQYHAERLRSEGSAA